MSKVDNPHSSLADSRIGIENDNSTEPSLLLMFPPLTEARHFPYLSLPQISGYLREQGHHVVQYDLNIDFCQRVFDSQLLRHNAQQHTTSPVAKSFLDSQTSFLARHATELSATVFGKQASDTFPTDVAIRLVQRGIELVTKQSPWHTVPESFSSLEEFVTHKPADPVTQLAKELVTAQVLKTKPAVVGISVAFFSQLAPTLSIAQWIKEIDPNIIIVLGGQQIMLRSDHLLALPNLTRHIDAVCDSSGEQPLDVLLTQLRSGSGLDESAVPGLRWISGKTGPSTTLMLRDLPTPSFDGLPITEYLIAAPQLPIITCVGCYWGRCVFCAYGNRSLKRNGYQQATPEQIADACEAAVRDWGISELIAADENTNLRLLAKGLRLLKDRGVSVRIRLRNRMEPSLLDRRFCQELADLGCVTMSCGYETNSQRLLDLMDKGVDASTYQTIIDNLHHVGIELRFSVMGGLFDETSIEAQESLDFLKHNAPKIGIDVLQMLVIEPGSLLSLEPERFHLVASEKEKLQGNPEFSYLGGRVGTHYQFEGERQRGQRSTELARVFHEITPGNNAILPPDQRRPSPAKRTTHVDHVQLHPWIDVLTDQENQPILADFAWTKMFRLAAGHTYQSASHTIHATDSKTSLSTLLDAGLALPIQADK